MNQDAEIKHRCQKMVEMFDGDSFQFFEAEFTLKIAEVTKKGREAVEAGKTEAAAYAMAELVALNKFYQVKEGIRARHQSLLDSDRERLNQQEAINA